MSTPITFNSTAYSVPAYNDSGYAQGPGNLSAYLIAISTGTLQPAGGTFTLTADVNFGSNFGLISKYYTSVTANAATAGAVRLARADTIDWRNQANSANLVLAVNSSDQLTYQGAVITTGSASAVTSITGTANQVIASASTGAVTLSLPQSIAAINSPTFANLNLLSTGTAPVLAFSNAAGTHGVSIGALGALAVDYQLFWPPTADSNHTVLRSGGLGVLNWGQVALSTDVSGTLPVANGGTGDASVTAYAVLCGGTTATGAFQSVSGLGSSGQALVSNGAAALPTWQTIGGSGTVNSGTANKFAYYATSTNAVSDSGIDITAPIFAGVTTGLVLSATQATNQLRFTGAGGGNQIRTISVTATTTAGEVITLPDTGGSASFVLTEGTQTLNGNKTISGTTNLSGLSASTALALDGSKNIVSVTNTGSGSNVLATSPTLVTPVLGAATATSLAFSPTTGGIIGTATNDNAGSGKVGEYVESIVGSTAAAASGVYKNITSISLTAGDWDVCGSADISNNGAAVTGPNTVTVDTTGAPSPTISIADNTNYMVSNSTYTWGGCVPLYRLSLASTTTVYLVVVLTYTVATPNVFASIKARRRR